ncbi:polysaccharide lyase [Adhaeribacter radiodurans]|uniref:Heparin lyase I family protein n=1 Tax=Adhaeribacter radiodurans TaxID=2745197 RepID=A0A7L7L237_9BACT|nr:polysaccharide lyase [Adhaeribacter radiodurans]QMU26857.1 heparin lyase I family protein [Adhaeribacter radiodurans]
MKKSTCLFVGLAFSTTFGFLPGCQSSGNQEEKTETATEKLEIRQPVIQSAVDSTPAIPDTVKEITAKVPEKLPATATKLVAQEPVKQKTTPPWKKNNSPAKPKKVVPAPSQLPIERANLRAEVNFAQGVPKNLRKQVTTAHGLTLDNQKTWKGQPLARFELTPDDVAQGVVRSEILLQPDNEAEVKYGWVMYFPKEYWDPSDEFDIVMQLHGYDDKHLGEKARNPQFALHVHKDHLKVTIHHSDLPVNTNKTDIDEKFDLGPLLKDKFLEMVLEIKHTYEPDGYARLFINGKKVMDYEGGTTFNDKRKYPYFKAGIYNRKVQLPRVVYISNIRHGNSKSSYKDVAP